MNSAEERWSYSDAEIRTMYQCAKDKAAQIRIISELCLRPVDLVVEKLRILGFDTIKKENPYQSAPRGGRVRNPWTTKEIEKLLELSRAGLHAEDAARVLKRHSAASIQKKARECGEPFAHSTGRKARKK